VLSAATQIDENPRSRAAKVAHSRERSGAIAAALEALKPAGDPRRSPIDELLLIDWKAHVLEARARGCSDSDIARTMAAHGCQFRPESIRARIRNVFGSNGQARGRSRKSASLKKEK